MCQKEIETEALSPHETYLVYIQNRFLIFQQINNFPLYSTFWRFYRLQE